jgi:hypothetical protein
MEYALVAAARANSDETTLKRGAAGDNKLADLVAGR